jgi:hypothetical protein
LGGDTGEILSAVAIIGHEGSSRLVSNSWEDILEQIELTSAERHWARVAPSLRELFVAVESVL